MLVKFVVYSIVYLWKYLTAVDILEQRIEPKIGKVWLNYVYHCEILQ